jgi:hypothetical protein
MAYAMARIFSGPSDPSPEQLDLIARQELVPQLLQIAGLRRYSTLALTDGRVGSFSVYESREAANRGLRVASEWVSSTDAARNYHLDETLRGEIAYTLIGQGGQSRQSQRNASGVARLYQTDASIDDVKTAIEQEVSEAVQHLPGLLRYALVPLEDGRIGSFAAFASQESARRAAELTSKLRTKGGSALGRLLPHAPQVLEGTILGTYTP